MTEKQSLKNPKIELPTHKQVVIIGGGVIGSEFASFLSEVGTEVHLFEMEDQRNWTDASYKTYGTPLALPFPAEINVGHKINKAVGSADQDIIWRSDGQPAS